VTPPPRTPAHLPALDGLRGVAILLVLAHGFDVIDAPGGVNHAVDMALDYGWIGVQLFFVLSGFLITGILLDTRTSPVYYRSFFIRRLLRIFPLYYGVLLVGYAILPRLTTPPPQFGNHQIWLWTYLVNFAEPMGRGEPAFPHFWSLAVEEQFYLVWPFVVRAAGRTRLIGWGAVLTLAAILVRLVVRARWGQEAAYMFTPCRMDALAIGALAAALIRGDRTARWIARWRPGTLVAAGGMLILAGPLLNRAQRTGTVMQTGGYTALALGFALILVAALPTAGAPARLLGSPCLRRIGTYSYAMYVFHAPLHLFIGLPLLAYLGASRGAAVGVAYAALAILVTFAAAALSYHLYERKFLALKTRLAPQRPA
jgi:peptidoglycan/LPS O-acetylase OafA/YrhL